MLPAPHALAHRAYRIGPADGTRLFTRSPGLRVWSPIGSRTTFLHTELKPATSPPQNADHAYCSHLCCYGLSDSFTTIIPSGFALYACRRALQKLLRRSHTAHPAPPAGWTFTRGFYPRHARHVRDNATCLRRVVSSLPPTRYINLPARPTTCPAAATAAACSSHPHEQVRLPPRMDSHSCRAGMACHFIFTSQRLRTLPHPTLTSLCWFCHGTFSVPLHPHTSGCITTCKQAWMSSLPQNSSGHLSPLSASVYGWLTWILSQ